MRPSSHNLVEVLKGSFSTRLIVDSFYGAERTQTNLPPGAWSLSWDVEADIIGRGDLTIIYTPEVAQSLTPTGFTDVLAAFGQELNILLEVSAGEFRESVQLGHFRIVSVPDARDSHADFLGGEVTVGSTVRVTLQSREVAVSRAGFRSEESPPTLDSCWAEMQRLTGMQVIRSVADRAIPASVVYLATQGGRLRAVQDLANVLGGIPYVTPDGALTVLPDAVGSPVAELIIGDGGTILDVAHSMDSDGVFNEIIGNFETEDRQPIFSRAAEYVGPLSINGPYGVHTKYVSKSDAPHVTTQAQADAYTAQVLDRSTSAQTNRVPVRCIINPLLEVGDMISVQRPQGRDLIGRIVNLKMSDARLMDLELDVTRIVRRS